MSRQHRLAAGISDGLVRVSIGCEDVEDLVADFEQAFAAVEAAEPVGTQV
jgi:cystathionine beta-lyase/cystathionine gamma-synthase